LWAFPLPDPRFLFDENVAAALVAGLSAGLAAGRDRAIWDYAAAHGFVLVTKDEDFHWLSVLLGVPPKVIWVHLGNCSTLDVARLLRARYREILGFIERPEATFLALG
jgi:predicted nuclease of predicted toxin-antitoxin system